MIHIGGKNYIEHGDVAGMRVHRGGEYYTDSNTHTGGKWVTKIGVMVCPDLGGTSSDKTVPNTGWVRFFDGDCQATNTLADWVGFPDGPKRFLRKATPEELKQAMAPYGFKGVPIPLGPVPERDEL